MSFEEIELAGKVMDCMLEDITGKVDKIRSLNE